MTEVEKSKVTNMTFTVPEGVKKRAQARRDVNWSAVVSQTIEERLKALELMDKLLKNSKLTERDVEKISNDIDAAMAKRLGVVK